MFGSKNVSNLLANGANSSGTTPCPTTGTCATATGSINGSGGSLRPGWLSRNYIETTGFANFDFRVQKDIRIAESKSLKFSWEVFNAFNHKNYGSYVTDEAAVNYGSPSQNTNVAYASRRLQLGFRLAF